MLGGYSYNTIDNHVTLHAVERFVERVLGFDKSVIKHRTMKVKEEIYLQIKHFTGLTGRVKVPMQDYPNHIAVLVDGVVITILEK